MENEKQTLEKILFKYNSLMVKANTVELLQAKDALLQQLLDHCQYLELEVDKVKQQTKTKTFDQMSEEEREELFEYIDMDDIDNYMEIALDDWVTEKSEALIDDAIEDATMGEFRSKDELETYWEEKPDNDELMKALERIRDISSDALND